MTLYNVVTIIPSLDLVTIADYITGEIYIDRDTPDRIINFDDHRWHHELKNCRVYGIEAGKVYGDIIISIVKE